MILKNTRFVIFLIIEFLSSALSRKSIRACLADQRGGLILPIDGRVIEDRDWIKYKSLKKDMGLKPINPCDLPGDFCQKACELVDEFRRKTVNENVEWMLYFDYKTGEVVYCWEGDESQSGGVFEKIHFESRNIASIHNHIKGYYSFPSPENFDILENDFEHYEVITSINALWTVEFNGCIDREIRENFQYVIGQNMNRIITNIKLIHDFNVDFIVEEVIGNYLLEEIDKTIDGTELTLIKKGYGFDVK